MKKFESLGKKLSKAEQKKIKGGDDAGLSHNGGQTQCFDSTCGGKKESGFGCPYPSQPECCNCYAC